MCEGVGVHVWMTHETRELGEGKRPEGVGYRGTERRQCNIVLGEQRVGCCGQWKNSKNGTQGRGRQRPEGRVWKKACVKLPL